MSASEADTQRQWRASNPEKVSAQRARSWDRNKEKRAAENKAWRERNPERVAAYRVRAEANRTDETKAARKEYHRLHYLSPHGRAIALTNSAKARAKALGIDFSVSAEWVEDRIAAGHCEATGIPFVLEPSSDTRRQPFGPSLDRTDPQKGYTEDNVKVVAVIYNLAKGDFAHEHVEILARAVLGMSSGGQK